MSSDDLSQPTGFHPAMPPLGESNESEYSFELMTPKDSGTARMRIVYKGFLGPWVAISQPEFLATSDDDELLLALYAAKGGPRPLA